TRRPDPLDWRVDYGSTTRDAAAVLTLAGENDIGGIDRAALARMVASGSGARQSTQEQLWTLLAAHALQMAAASEQTVSLDGWPLGDPPVRAIASGELAGPGLRLRNDGATAIPVVLTTRGAPAEPEPASADGYRIERWLYTLDGQPVDPAA